jgi:hypothetical protein
MVKCSVKKTKFYARVPMSIGWSQQSKVKKDRAADTVLRQRLADLIGVKSLEKIEDLKPEYVHLWSENNELRPDNLFSGGKEKRRGCLVVTFNSESFYEMVGKVIAPIFAPSIRAKCQDSTAQNSLNLKR